MPRRSARLIAAAALVLAGALGATAATTSVDKGTGPDFHPATFSYDNEPGLVPTRVQSGFGQAWQFPSTAATSGLGQMYARPVMATDPSGAKHLIASVEEDYVYGINPTTGKEQWHTQIGWPFDTSKPILPGGRTCGDLNPRVGITSTPTVGPDGTVYVMGKMGDADDPDGTRHAHFELHALDPRTGAEKPGFPVVLNNFTADNAPGVSFQAAYENQRAALLLLNGVVYAAFAGHCDLGPYRGWIVGTRIADHTVVAKWVDETEPDADVTPGDDDGEVGPQAGVWQGGAPLVGDGATGFYFATGNGDYPTAAIAGGSPDGTLGESVVHLVAQPDGTLAQKDFFTPTFAGFLNSVDVDLGSGGPSLLPSDFGTAQYPHLAIVAGKSGDIFILNADNLGGYKQGTNGGDAYLSRTNVFPGIAFGKMAVYDGPTGQHFVYVRVGSTLRVYTIAPDGSGKPQLVEVGRDDGGAIALAGSPIVTSVGKEPGTGVVWAEWEPNFDGTNSQLRAYSATPNPDHSLTMLGAWSIGQAAKFQAPLVFDGWVYTAGKDGIVRAFHNPAAVPLSISGGDAGTPVVVGQQRWKKVTITATAPVTITSVQRLGGAASPFRFDTPSPATPTTLATGQSMTISYVFAPTGAGGFGDTLRLFTSAGQVDAPLSGVGQLPVGDLDVNPALIVGTYPVGQSPTANPTTATLVLTNDGATPVTLVKTTVPAAPFTVAAVPANTVIPAGSTLAIPVGFKTQTVGSYDDRFTFDWQPRAAGSAPTVVAVHADAVAPPKITFSPAPPGGGAADVVAQLNFGTAAVGTSVTKSFTLANVGGSPAVLSISKVPASPSLSFPDPLPEGHVLNPGDVVTVPITWTPTTAGPLVDNWTFDVGAGTGKVLVHLIGTATS